MMNFSQALDDLKRGLKVARVGWNGKGMFLFYNPGSEVAVSEKRPLATAFAVGTSATMLPYIMMKVAGDKLCLVPWVASQTDILAEDWFTLTEPE